jgi:hypothetical protein
VKVLSGQWKFDQVTRSQGVVSICRWQPSPESVSAPRLGSLATFQEGLRRMGNPVKSALPLKHTSSFVSFAPWKLSFRLDGRQYPSKRFGPEAGICKYVRRTTGIAIPWNEKRSTGPVPSYAYLTVLD